MYKFTCFVLFAVAVAISRVHASEEERAAFRKAVKPIIDECSQEHGVSADELKSAKSAQSAEGIKPCFIGCVFKKIQVINDKGEYDVDTALTKLKKYVSNEDDYAKFAEVGKKCASVNEKAVSDGAAGCERGAMLAACFLEHKAEIPIHMI